MLSRSFGFEEDDGELLFAFSEDEDGLSFSRLADASSWLSFFASLSDMVNCVLCGGGGGGGGSGSKKGSKRSFEIRSVR